MGLGNSALMLSSHDPWWNPQYLHSDDIGSQWAMAERGRGVKNAAGWSLALTGRIPSGFVFQSIM